MKAMLFPLGHTAAKNELLQKETIARMESLSNGQIPKHIGHFPKCTLLQNRFYFYLFRDRIRVKVRATS